MSRTLKVTGNYNLYAMGTSVSDASPNGTITLNGASIIVPGNLTVQGTTTSVESQNTVLVDNIITLNQGEAGAGVTLGSSGLQIDRGSLDDAKFIWDEVNDRFTFMVGASPAEVYIGTLTGATLTLDGSFVTIDSILDEDDFISDSATGVPTQQSTKAYIASQFAAFTDDRIEKNDSSIIITDTGSNGTITSRIDGTVRVILNSTGFQADNLKINNNTISSLTTDQDIVFDPNGAGAIDILSPVKLSNQGSNPLAEAGMTKLYAKTPTTSGSGLYFRNNTNGVQELISKKRARLFGLIF
jgi:hypothetical protein